MATIQLTKGYVTVVDDADVETLSAHKWRALVTTSGAVYAVSTIRLPDGREYALLMHRLLLGLPYGDKREGDHRNGDGLNNRRSNLRIATHRQNSNNARLSRANASGFKGVSWSEERGCWRAQIKRDGVRYHIGNYADPEEAHEAYCLLASVFHGTFANDGNGPIAVSI